MEIREGQQGQSERQRFGKVIGPRVCLLTSWTDNDTDDQPEGFHLLLRVLEGHTVAHCGSVVRWLACLLVVLGSIPR